MTAWTEARIEKLKHRWTVDGWSAALIASEMKVSRNAILGKVHRLGLSGRVPVASARPPKAERKPAKKPRVRIKPGPSEPTVRIVAAPAPVICEPVTLTQAGPCHCRWVIDDTPGAVVFCGSLVRPGTSWCPGHYTRVFRPAHEQPKRRAA